MKQFKQICLFTAVAVVALLFTQCEKGESADGATVGQGGSTARFTIVDNYLYAVDEAKLNIFFLENALNPVPVGEISVNDVVETIFSKDSLLFIGTSLGVFIYETTTPSSPKLLGEFGHVFSCDPVVADDKYAYVTLSSRSTRCNRQINQLDILDISNPNYPRLIQSRSMIEPKGLAITDSLLFVCDEGVKIFDRSNPENPELIGYAEAIKANDLIVIGEHVIVTAETGIYQYRINGSKLELISTLYSS